MSSNPSRERSKNQKVTSIAYRLEWQLVRKKFALYINSDLFLTLCLILGWAYMLEYTATKSFVLERHRDFIGSSLEDAVYQILDAKGAVLVSEPIMMPVVFLSAMIGSIFILQLLSIIFHLYGETRRYRKILSPINDFALRADEMAQMAMDEEKMHRIEDTIDHIRPDENQPVRLGDSELEGVEAAVNNLLVRLRDSYRQQTRFVNDASHELRTPIAVIQGYANMLKRWGRDDEAVLNESINAIVTETDHMKTLVEQLLFLARGDAGKTELHPELLDLGALMQEIYEESLMIDEAHPYRLRKCDESIQIHADPALMKQAVRILVDNAAKYTKAGDEIILGTGWTSDRRPYMMVEDTGIGMSQADCEHMFERFYRSDEARSYQGTGLGLSIAKWIVDRHKGHFEVISRLDIGTRIMIVL